MNDVFALLWSIDDFDHAPLGNARRAHRARHIRHRARADDRAGAQPARARCVGDELVEAEVHLAAVRLAEALFVQVGGQLTSFSGPIGHYLPHVKPGRLPVLATSGPKRSRFLPAVRTYNELGSAPELVQQLAGAIRTAMAGPEMADALGQYGLEVSVTSPAELAKAVQDENAAWGPIVKRVGFTPES